MKKEMNVKKYLCLIVLLCSSTAHALPPVTIASEGLYATAIAEAWRSTYGVKDGSAPYSNNTDTPVSGSAAWALDTTGQKNTTATKQAPNQTIDWKAEAESVLAGWWTPLDLAGAPTTVDNPFLKLTSLNIVYSKVPATVNTGKLSYSRGDNGGFLYRVMQYTGANPTSIECDISIRALYDHTGIPDRGVFAKAEFGDNYLSIWLDQYGNWVIDGYTRKTANGSLTVEYDDEIDEDIDPVRTYTCWLPVENSDYIVSHVKIGYNQDPRSDTTTAQYSEGSAYYTSGGGNIDEANDYFEIKITPKVTATTY
jgi:hypothetical protein